MFQCICPAGLCSEGGGATGSSPGDDSTFLAYDLRVSG